MIIKNNIKSNNKNKYALFIEDSYYQNLYKIAGSFKIQQLTNLFPFVVPALTGIAQIHGIRTVANSSHYGLNDLTTFVIKNYSEIGKHNICDQLVSKKINKIIFIDSNKIAEIECN